MKFDEKILNEDCIVKCSNKEQASLLFNFLHSKEYMFHDGATLNIDFVKSDMVKFYGYILQHKLKTVTCSLMYMLHDHLNLYAFEDIYTKENKLPPEWAGLQRYANYTKYKNENQVHEIESDNNPFETITQAINAMSESIRQIVVCKNQIQESIEEVKKAMVIYENKGWKI
jgi:hypothetical protein